MNDFHGLLSSDFGLKPQGKSAPMAPPKPNSAAHSAFNFEIGGTARASFSKSSSGSFLGDHDSISRPSTNRKPQDFSDLGGFDDVFGGSSKPSGNSSLNLDSIFSGSGDSAAKFSSLPVFDKPVYDDDAYDGVSGLKSSSSVFSTSNMNNDAFDDLLGGLGRVKLESRGSGSGSVTRGTDQGIPSFDDLLPGFGGNTTAQSERHWPQKSTANLKTSSTIEDPFVVVESSSPVPSSSGIFDDPLEQMSNLNSSSTRKVDTSASLGVFDDIDPLDGLSKSMPGFSSEKNDREKDGSPLRAGSKVAGRQASASEASHKSNIRNPVRGSEKKMPAEEYQDYPRNVFDMPSVAEDSYRSVPNSSSPSHVSANFNETNSQEHVSPRSEENVDSSDDVWLNVSEIPLYTQPTTAPPPSRPPPPRPAQFSRAGAGSFAPTYVKKKIDEYSAFHTSTPYFQSSKSASGEKNSFVSSIDELEKFAVGKNRNHVDGSPDILSGENVEANSVAAASAAAMKEAMDRAEAKFRHAKEVRERENAKATKMHQERGEKTMQDAQDREFRERQEQMEHERQQREREEEERRQREGEEEERRQKEEEERRRIERERVEKEMVQRRLEREREMGRQAVERATREARERAAVEARARAERAAVEKAQVEARERAERAAVQRVQAEARERAAREAKEKAEKAAAEAREKEARERAAAVKANQQKNENDLESIFGMGSRASSAPRPRACTSDPIFDTQFQSKQAPEAMRTSVGSTSSMRKASSSANIADDLSSIFGGPPSSGEFQEVEGESEERRAARLERHRRTQERAAKALAEKNQRDLQAQREQAERHRIAETLDVEIKRWATGKEGNLRALLSTLHYVLWPECGWQAVSLTDLITAASVKKVYRKATLCIHPDKVQQKGASLQQKYLAEKVFDILKEAWNKFNSEELF
ncbi:hypothetical protein Nepgr_009528 [Nepenthes gracilis]|uniref:J domain-containing protein n=1 Tax=Nepenthes gracilis TaxID=150966 RepID=A0AAD3SAN7_NEPGR|nr:hypothetical protein Nepgr_009528 [Nepenthes gracilis]